MQKTIEENKEINKQILQKLEGFIEKAHNTFATKQDHKDNSSKISDLEKSISNINLKIATVTGGFTVIIYIFEKLIK